MPMKKSNLQAVALRYDTEKDQAPTVVAKGSGYIAEKIILAAQQHDIPLVNDPVAESLLGKVDLGTEIPAEFYHAVAEILAFIYRINNDT